MHRDQALVENTRDWVQDNVRFAVDGPAPPPWRQLLIEEPTYVAASQADFMRDDDYVIALDYQGATKVYPLWIIDYYHTIHDQIGDEPFVVFS